jgi:presenilin-like A22 family membrane protease
MAENESKVFKPRPKHLLPVILGLIATGVLAYPISLAAPQRAQVTPFDVNSASGASLNAVVFVFALGASATVMFLLIRRGRMRFIRRLVKGALILVSFAVAFWYSTSILASVVDLSTDLWTLVSLLLSVGIAATIGFTIFGKGQTRQLSGVTALGALTGVFLGYSVGPVTALVLVGALVVYDIVAVFRGPVGALAKAVEAGDLPGAMYTYGELTIGMGDLVFYSLVATIALVFYSPLSFLGAALGIVAGSYLGFRALSRFEMFPGLPFSLLLGVAGMLLVALATSTPILGTPR